jgi:hypothetical protein
MSIQRFDYAGVVGDIDYAEGTYVRYEDHLSALESITGDIVDKAWALGYAEAEQHFTNDCFSCGYAGEWSTWTCDACMKERKEEDDEGS